MKYTKGHTIYFLGIGGIGMSALARYFNSIGLTVYGYDRTSTKLTRAMENEGMHIHYKEDIQHLSISIDLAVYTPAIPESNIELQYLRKSNIPLIKRAELLGQLSNEHFTIAVAGTHGKTTITSMIAHILHGAGKNICAFIGGIANNFNSNLVLSNKPDFFVVEADEFDKSFLQLQPSVAVISSIDADHLDIYESRDHMIDTYTHFAEKTALKGNLIIKSGIQLTQDLPFNTYGFAENCTVFANNISIRDGRFEFDICSQGSVSRVVMMMGGRHNIENALAAASACLQCGINLHDISKLLSTYKGVWRRFDVQVSNENVTYIDDYAHHPEELKACIQAARELFPEKKITGVFQPHLFSRTRDFMTDFAKSLSLLDQLILLDIYPARELPIQGITSAALLEKVFIKQKVLLAKHELIPALKAQKPEVLLTMGAGDIDLFVEPIKEMLLTC